MKKKISIISTLIIIYSCSINTNNNLEQIKTLSTIKQNPEDLVSVQRLKNNLAVLSGNSPFEETIISERGSIEGRRKTREFLSKKLSELGYTIEKHSYRKNGENIYVKIMADIPTDEYILVGAHMDSVKNAGANDNGTGSTAVLELAYILKNLKNKKLNIILAWFDEEELGLIGSYEMAKYFKKLNLKINSVHTIDMMGWDSNKNNLIEIERPDGDLWEYYQAVNKAHNLNFPLRRTNSGSTDHVAFRENGFKSVGLCEEWVGGDTTPHYHKKSDTYENIHFNILESGTKLLAAVISDLSLGVNYPIKSKFIPHDQFPGKDRHFHKF
ncbi:MAG: hypothetical protein KatS3mg068_1790 [Candidatus Sericytochromatia bacterium]|nr:MAG: hypothetical protein KatS3mg068_1790 [Candidatus Sericytochromatia bacterium]